MVTGPYKLFYHHKTLEQNIRENSHSSVSTGFEPRIVVSKLGSTVS